MPPARILLIGLLCTLLQPSICASQESASWAKFNAPTQQAMLLGISYGSYLNGWAKAMVATMDETARTGSRPESFVFRDLTLTSDVLDKAGNDVATWAKTITALYGDERNAHLKIVVVATAAACTMNNVPGDATAEALQGARQYDELNEQVVAFLTVIERAHFFGNESEM